MTLSIKHKHQVEKNNLWFVPTLPLMWKEHLGKLENLNKTTFVSKDVY